MGCQLDVLAGRGESRCRNVGTALEGFEGLPEGPSVAWEPCKHSKRVWYCVTDLQYSALASIRHGVSAKYGACVSAIHVVAEHPRAVTNHLQ